MQDTSIITIPAAIGVGLALIPSRRTTPPALGPSMWNVEVDCPDVGDVRAYDWRFPAQAASGVVTGHYQSPTNEAMGNLSGRIRPDGEALLTMVGKVGASDSAIGHFPPEPGSATPPTSISTRIAALANATSGAPARCDVHEGVRTVRPIRRKMPTRQAI
jgi:hypothetical protein